MPDEMRAPICNDETLAFKKARLTPKAVYE
jgi:hypothetical protein